MRWLLLWNSLIWTEPVRDSLNLKATLKCITIHELIGTPWSSTLLKCKIKKLLKLCFYQCETWTDEKQNSSIFCWACICLRTQRLFTQFCKESPISQWWSQRCIFKILLCTLVSLFKRSNASCLRQSACTTPHVTHLRLNMQHQTYICNMRALFKMELLLLFLLGCYQT